MSSAKEIAFIDATVAGLESLLAGLRPEIEPILLSSSLPATRQIADALGHIGTLGAVHIVAHGRPGEVSFGAGALSLENLNAQAADLAGIGRALDEHGTLCLWSCQTAREIRGQTFVARLAAAVGTAVAASTRLVGAAAEGGSWELDHAGRRIGLSSLLTAAGQAAFAGVLVTKSGMSSLDILKGTADADTFKFTNDQLNPGDSVVGYGSIDTLALTSATVNADLQGLKISGVEVLSAGGGDDTVRLSGRQFLNFSWINTGGGTDTVEVAAHGVLKFAPAAFPALTSVETLKLTGSSIADTLTLSGTQLNTFSSINLGEGADRLSLTSTSTKLNGLSDASLQGVEVISALPAGSGTEINLGKQTEGVTIIGSFGHDVLTGGSGNDTIHGRGGRDTIKGGAGNDVIHGGLRSDNLNGGSGSDTVSYVWAGRGVSVDLAVTAPQNTVGAGFDTLFGFENITGSSHNDVLTGDTSANVIDGGTGDDVLTGGFGADQLIGGAGNDTFVFTAVSAFISDSNLLAGVDRIVDFTQGQDKINVGALLGTVDLIWGGTTPAAGGIWYEQAGGNTYVYAQLTSSSMTPELAIRLDGLHMLTAADFVSVTPGNNAPYTVDVNATATEDASAIAIFLHAADPGGSVARFRLSSLPENGTLTTDPAGLNPVALATSYAASGNALTLYFHPAANWNGTTTFQYVAVDNVGAVDATPATASITVTPVNDVPTADDDSATVNEGGSIITPNVLANDSDADGPLSAAMITGFTQGTHGSVVYNNDGTFSYTHDGSESTADSFTYTVDDGAGGTTTATVQLTVNPVNDAPELTNPSTVTFLENGTAIAINAALSVTDIDGTDLAGATVAITGNFASGQDVLGFVNQNGISGSYDATSGILTLTGIASVADYQLALRSVTYANSSDNPSTQARTISFQVDDGQAANPASNVITSTVDITSLNDAPVGSDDTSSATEASGISNGTPDGNATGNVLTNDTDVDNLTAELVVSAVRTGTAAGTGTAGTVGSALTGAYGALTLSSDGSYSYVVNDTDSAVQGLNAGQTLTDTFTYTLEDPGNLTHTAQLTITIHGVNDTPLTVGDNVITNVGTGASVVIPESWLLANDLDPNGSALDVTGVGGEVGGTVNHTAGGAGTGSVTFTDDPTLGGTFSYAATDGVAPGSTAVVTVTNHSAGTPTLNGTAGSDIIIGGTTADTLDGGAGNDFLDGGLADDTYHVTLGQGSDTIADSAGTADVLNINGVTGADTVTVTAAGSSLTAISGISAFSGIEQINLTLLAGTNTLSYGTTGSDVTVNLTALTATGFDAISGVQHVISGSGDDSLIGDSNVNFLAGGSGRDVLTGSAGGDTLTGGADSDTFIFAAGDTTVALGGNGDAGTIAGYDSVTDFTLANGGDASELLDLPETADVVANTTGTDGANSGLTIGGNPISSHAISDGIITFDDADTFAGALSLTTVSEIAAAVEYLQANDLGNIGSTVAFTADISGVAHTFVYAQGNDSADAVLVDLVGVAATGLHTTAITTAGDIQIA